MSSIVLTIGATICAADGLTAQSNNGSAGNPDTITTARTEIALTVSPTYRAYTVGDFSVSEASTGTRLAVSRGRFLAEVVVTPLRFSGDTSASTAARQHTLAGATAGALTVSWTTWAQDALRITARTASQPARLAPADAAALGAVATASLPLSALSLSAPPSGSASYALDRPIGNSGTVFRLLVAGDIEQKPSDSSQVAWRGTTVFGRVELARETGRLQLRGTLSGSQSSADSLNGNNLFTGGGAITGGLTIARLFRADSGVRIEIATEYSKPFSQTRQEVPTRVIPVGETAMISLAARVMAGGTLVEPGVTYVAERSSAVRRVNNRVSQVTGSSGIATAFLRLTIPLGAHISVTPEAGGSIGNVSQDVTGVVAPRFRRSVQRSGSFSDSVRGGYVTLGVTMQR